VNRARLIPAVLCLLCGCWSWPVPDGPDLVGGYALWAIDTREQMSLVKKLPKGTGEAVVAPTVFAAGWNNDFIMVIQHPGDGFHPPDKSVSNYFILRLKDEKLFGPLAKDQFETQRKALGVPEDLDFKLVFKDLK